jgi:hypothetical protein
MARLAVKGSSSASTLGDPAYIARMGMTMDEQQQ